VKKKPTPYAFDLDGADIRRERTKARELRQSQWWKRKIAKGECQYCGQKSAPADLTMDHIVPLARGGRSTKGNLAAACKECNNLKRQMLPTEWVLYLDKVKKGSGSVNT
jgi:5-methylcytosine-specific restriction endonuclease McrA